MSSFQKVLNSLPATVSLRYAAYTPGTPKDGEHEWLAEPQQVVFSMAFSEPGFGFGEITFKQTPAGLFLDTECMDPERVKRYLGMLVDKAIKDTDEDPEKHALFCREWQRSCGCAQCSPGEYVGLVDCIDPNTCGGDCEGCFNASAADELGD